ncbi:MAG: prepilin peptidase [Chloroflexi bacterium]|nr:prepilin peptidase [Chloroflexota bacterium]
MIYTSVMVVLAIAVFTDLRHHKIYNKLTLTAAALGIALNAIKGGPSGLLFSLEGFALGLAFLLIPFVLGGMGAGDVKLLAALGAFLGPWLIFNTFLYGAIAGGLIAVIILIRRKQLVSTIYLLLSPGRWLLAEGAQSGSVYFPYALAIALGTLIALGLP